MNFQTLANLAGYGQKINRTRRLIMWVCAALGVFIATMVATSWALYHYISTTYASNYYMLKAHGLSDVVASPGLVESNILLLTSFTPLVGVLFLLPCLIAIVIELRRMVDELERGNTDNID